ncbi:unnamed protein product, partial [Ixodes persulcatus]
EPDESKRLQVPSPVVPFWGMSWAVFGQVGVLNKQNTDFTITIGSGSKIFEAFQREGQQDMTVLSNGKWIRPDTRFSNQQVPAGHYLWLEVTLVSPGVTEFYVNGALVSITDKVDESHMSDYQQRPRIGYHDAKHQGSVWEIHWTRVDGKEINIFPQNPT